VPGQQRKVYRTHKAVFDAAGTGLLCRQAEGAMDLQQVLAMDRNHLFARLELERLRGY
jgi:hypothetical protein